MDTVHVHDECVLMIKSQEAHPYLQNDLCRFRLAHRAITVIGSAGVHADSIVISCCYKNGALRVHHPTWELEKKGKNTYSNCSEQVNIVRIYTQCEVVFFFYHLHTLSRFKSFPSLVQLTYSTGGSAWTGQTMTPSMPAGKYVSRGIRPTRAGSKMKEEELTTRPKACWEILPPQYL